MIDSVGIYSISFRPKYLDTFISWAVLQGVQSVDLQAGSRGYDFCRASTTMLATSAKQLVAQGIRVELLTSELDIGVLDKANLPNVVADLAIYIREIERFQAKGLRIFADRSGTAAWPENLVQLAQAWPTISFVIELHSAWWMETSIIEDLLRIIVNVRNIQFLLDYEKIVQHAPMRAATLLEMLLPFSRMVHLGFPPLEPARAALVRHLIHAPQHYVVHLEALSVDRESNTITKHFNAFRRAIADIQADALGIDV